MDIQIGRSDVIQAKPEEPVNTGDILLDEAGRPFGVALETANTDQDVRVLLLSPESKELMAQIMVLRAGKPQYSLAKTPTFGSPVPNGPTVVPDKY